METSQIKTIGQALGQMDLSDRQDAQRKTCDQHGDYESTFYRFGGGFWSGCPACDRERMAAEDAKATTKAEIERKEIRMRNALQRAAIPPRFQDRQFATFVPSCEGAKNALNVIKTYARGFDDALATGRNLILFGTVGSGKTHLAVSAAHSVIDQGYSAVFASVMSAVRSVKETYRKGADRTERDAIEALIAPDLLILDEVGVQFGSDAEKLILFEIINGRYESMRPTIVISNLNMAGLQEYLGERVVDRLREGGGRAILFDWPSYRKGGA
uniref:ATP-binding protein n=1 Tax=Castellaniella defragrans TaxID=75697 RepID=UPI00333EA0DC